MWIPLLFFAVCGATLAQSTATTGAIHGTVTDTSGLPIPGARITVTELGSHATRQAVTGEAGQFHLAGLPVGVYRLRVEHPGFAPVVMPQLRLSVGQTLVQRVEMKLAQLTDSVEVREQSDALDSASTTASSALGGERIEESPAQNRNYLNFVLAAPGVLSAPGANPQRAPTSTRSASPDSGFVFGGMRARNNSLSIDGVDNRDETTGGNRVAVGLEMVQEFQVAGAILGAEFGGAAGGAVNVVTRSGTNVWHGDTTLFLQNEAVNARNPEVGENRKPRFRRFQPGASINGPVRRDQTFFSTALEQEWEFSEEWSEAPAAWLEAMNRALAQPVFMASGAHAVSRGLFPAQDIGTEFSFKLNHQTHSGHSLSARYAISRGRVFQDVHALENFTDRSARASSLTRDHSFVSSWTSVMTPRLVNDFRVQIAQRAVVITPNSSAPMFEIPGVLTFGQAWRLNGQRTENHYQIGEGINAAWMRHLLSAGISIHTVTLQSRLAHRFAGIFVFPTLSDFLQARPDVYLQAFGDPHTAFSTLPVGVWMQDRWAPASGWTLEAGLRYDRQAMPPGVPASTRNFAPRLGLAWQPGGRGPYVLRAGFGLFYDRYPLAFLNDALQNVALHYLTGEAAVQALLGHIPAAPRGRFQVSPRFPTTYSRKLTFGAERAFGQDTKLTLELSHVDGFHLPRVRNIALHLPPLYQLEQTARSHYNGLSLSLNRRMSRELTFLIGYSFGRTQDDASDFDEHPLDPGNLRLDWGLSRLHQARRFAASAVFEPPLLGDVRGFHNVVIAPIFTAASGRPVNALDSTDAFRTGAYPISARPFGLPRNPFLGPAYVSLDLRVMKGIWLKKDRAILQLGAEAFNLMNHSNPLRVSPYYAAGGTPLTSYRQAVETLNARQMQLVFQVEY